MKRFLLQLVLIIFVGINAIAQTHTVTGKVVDHRGEPLPGSDISVVGANIGTVSDLNGDWLLEVPDGITTFYAQASGYNPRTVEDSSQFVLIELASASKEQEGNVIKAHGIISDRREVGYNAVTVGNEDLTTSNNISLAGCLAGKVTGANISFTGGYGGMSNIVLRGQRTFLQDNNALIVVDGVPINNFQRTASSQGISNILNQVDFGNGANDINPEDIAMVTVLGGSAAAALYGNAGSNGAIMITTKSGKEGGKSKMEVSYKMTYTTFQALETPDVQHNYGQGDVYAGNPDYRSTNYSWGLPFDGYLRPWGQIIEGKQMVKPYSDQPNNLNYFFNYGSALSNYASVNGNSSNSTYFLSLNSINSTGIIPSNYYKRYNARFNGTMKLANNFYTGINFNYMNSNSRAEYEGNGGSTGNAGIMENLINTPRDIPVWEMKNLSSKFFSMNYIDLNGIHRYGNYNAHYANPYWAAENFNNYNYSDRVTGDVKLGYKNGDFDVYERLGADYNADRSFYQTPYYIVSTADQTNLYPGNSYLNTGFTSNGGYAQGHYNGLRIYNDIIGNFNHALSRNWGFDFTLGNNITLMHDAVFNSAIDPKANGLIIPDFYNFSNSKSAPTSYNYLTEHRTAGVFSDIRFNYEKELYLTITNRIDWSSTYNYYKAHYFPGGNIAWIFTERMKGFIKDKVLNFGKLRFGAAGAGNDAIAYANNNAGYAQLPILSTNGSIGTPFNTLPIYQIQNTYGDQNLRPELTREYEAGVDLSFLKDRLSYSFTYYNAYTYNLIAATPVPPSTGFSYNFVNVGDVTNRGVEMLLRATPVSTKWGFKWDVFGTYTHNVNNVVNINNGNTNVVLGTADGMELVAVKDHPLGTFYGADISTWLDPKTGILHTVVDPVTGLPIPTAKPVYRGNFQPNFIASWGTDFTWNGLKLHVLFTTKQGGQYYSHIKEQMDINGTAPETIINKRKPLVWANSVYQVGNTNNYLTNTTKYLPYDYFVNEIGKNLLPGQNLVDASYIKLQEISLSYSIPRKYYARSPFGGLEAGLFANNLFIWNAAGNQYGDPEVATSVMNGNNPGYNYSAAPTIKSYGFFFKVGF